MVAYAKEDTKSSYIKSFLYRARQFKIFEYIKEEMKRPPVLFLFKEWQWYRNDPINLDINS